MRECVIYTYANYGFLTNNNNFEPCKTEPKPTSQKNEVRGPHELRNGDKRDIYTQIPYILVILRIVANFK